MRLYFCLLGIILSLLSASTFAQQHNWALLASSCAACHGTDGKSKAGIPALAGLDKLYFIKQMHDFKSGARSSTVMKQQASGYTDAEIDALAGYFSNK